MLSPHNSVITLDPPVVISGVPSRSKSRNVLIVEDHPPTAELLASAIDETDVEISSRVVHTGHDCLSILFDESEQAFRPDLVFLDLELPDTDGISILEKIQDERALRRIPVIVLSGTNDQDTIRRCYEAGATAFISKPDNLNGFFSIADGVVSHWFTVVELPAGNC